MRSALLLSFVLLVAPAVARADRPTSGDMSLASGRTLGNGETAMSAGAGWPGVFGQVTFAPSSTFNLGVRAAFLYGSPIVGFATGVGGEVGVPMRVHVLGEGDWDLAVHLRPYVVLGRGAAVGVDGDSIFDDNLGFGALAEVGLLAGWHPDDAITLALGLVTGWGLLSVPDADATAFAGNVLARIGLEYLMRRDVMLFVDLEAGGGFTTAVPFTDGGVVRAFLGAAFLL